MEEVVWQHMAAAPKDGTRVLVTIRSSEQGPAEVDVAYWARGDQHGPEGWRSADSHPGQIFGYAEPELKCWMPMPKANPTGGSGLPDPWEGTDSAELFGSGI